MNGGASLPETRDHFASWHGFSASKACLGFLTSSLSGHRLGNVQPGPRRFCASHKLASLRKIDAVLEPRTIGRPRLDEHKSQLSMTIVVVGVLSRGILR